MSNSYGILPAAFDNNANKMFLDDPVILIKILGDPSWTTFKALGYAEVEKTFDISNSYAEFKSGIPQRTVVKNVIESKTSFECKIKQLQPETIALLSQAIVEDKSTEKRVWLGSQLPAQIYMSIILQGNTLDGKQVELRIRKASVSTESLKIALGGKEYVSLDFKCDVLVDDDPLGNNFTWSVMGEIETTATITSGSTDIVVASASGLSAGMLAYSAGSKLQSDTTIDHLSGTTVTLTKAAVSSGSLIDFKAVSEANSLASDVAYWVFES